MKSATALILMLGLASPCFAEDPQAVTPTASTAPPAENTSPAATSAPVSAPLTVSSQKRGLKLIRVRLYDVFDAQYGAISDNQGWVNSAGLSWDPQLLFTENFGISLDLGAQPLKGKTYGDVFVAFEYLAYFTGKYGNWELELGGGGQTWTSHGSHFEMASDIAWLPPSGSWLGSWVERFFAGYSAVFADPTYVTHQFKVGVGFGI